MSPVALPVVDRSASASEIVGLMHEAGAVRIRGFLTGAQVACMNKELDEPIAALPAGSRHDHEMLKEFHGAQTKRLTNLVTHSSVFRELLDDDLFHDINESIYREEAGDWWISSGQVIEIGAGNKAQMLHRDMENFLPFVMMGKDSPMVTVNIMTALTPFTEANGATRVIPGSQHWDNYVTDRGSPEMTIPAEMDPGDGLLFSGKVVHGGGANATNRPRRGFTTTTQPAYLTQEDAFAFIVDMELARTLSPRAQKIIGFRSQYPLGSAGLWQNNYEELANYLKL